jgi:hypothetical protein
MRRDGTGNRGGRRRPKRPIDTGNIKVIKCKFCKQPITFSFGSVGRDGKKIPTNLNGTMHVDGGRSK